MKHAKIFATLFVAFALSACVAPIQHDTPSGKPEVSIPGGDLAQAKSRLISNMVDRGYFVAQDSGYTLVVDKQLQGVEAGLANSIFGSTLDYNPHARVTYSFSNANDVIRIIADTEIISDPGSILFEKRTNMNNTRGSLDIQAELDRLK